MKCNWFLLWALLVVAPFVCATPAHPTVYDISSWLDIHPIKRAPTAQLCVYTGACCLPNAACAELNFGQCRQQGGYFQGYSTGCDCQDCSILYSCCAFGDCLNNVTAYTCSQINDGIISPPDCQGVSCPVVNPCTPSLAPTTQTPAQVPITLSPTNVPVTNAPTTNSPTGFPSRAPTPISGGSCCSLNTGRCFSNTINQNDCSRLFGGVFVPGQTCTLNERCFGACCYGFTCIDELRVENCFGNSFVLQRRCANVTCGPTDPFRLAHLYVCSEVAALCTNGNGTLVPATSVFSSPDAFVVAKCKKLNSHLHAFEECQLIDEYELDSFNHVFMSKLKFTRDNLIYYYSEKQYFDKNKD